MFDKENEAGRDAKADEGRSTRPEADSGEPAFEVAQTEAPEEEARLCFIAGLIRGLKEAERDEQQSRTVYHSRAHANYLDGLDACT